MPTLDEIVKIIGDIDVSKSSCVHYVNARFCKDLMLSVPNVILTIYQRCITYICNTSLVTGKIPKDWTEGTIAIIPKDGDLTDPGNWRPITQTAIFAKLLEKLVYVRLLK